MLDSYPNVSLVTCISGTFGDVVTYQGIAPHRIANREPRVILESLNHGKGNWLGEPSVVMFRTKQSCNREIQPKLYLPGRS